MSPNKEVKKQIIAYIAKNSTDPVEQSEFIKLLKTAKLPTAEMNALLFQAVSLNAPAAIKVLLQEPSIDVNAVDSNNQTPLILAADAGYPECIIELLKAKNIDVNRSGQEDRTPLMHAAAKDHLQCVYSLLEAPSLNINAGDECGNTALMHAVSANAALSTWLLLRDKRIEVNSLNIFNKRTALHLAAQNGNPLIVFYLLAHQKTIVAIPDITGKTPLMWASESQNKECIAQLEQAEYRQIMPAAPTLQFSRKMSVSVDSNVSAHSSTNPLIKKSQTP